MKTILITLLFILNLIQINSQDIEGELLINNYSNIERLKVSVYPIGFIFNWNHDYVLKVVMPINKYIIGGSEIIGLNGTLLVGFDNTSNLENYIGYGRYRITFAKDNPDTNIFDIVSYVDVDFTDYNYPVGYEDGQFTTDLSINFYGINNIKYKFSCEEMVLPQEKLINIWDQRTPTCSTLYKIPNKGPYNSGVFHGTWNNYPFNATQSPYNAYDHQFPGSLFTYLDILQYHEINIINNLKIEPCARLSLLNGSRVIFYTEKKIDVYGAFCNYGATISGDVSNIIFYPTNGCSKCDGQQYFVFNDNSIVELTDSASWKLDSGSTILFNGPNSKLIMNPNSAIYFGKDAKLILRDGARLIANNATFTYLDSTDKTWDGIYLENLSNDTITNCTIENAINGINIINKTSVSENPNYSTQITGCTFKNTTSSTSLNYGINI